MLKKAPPYLASAEDYPFGWEIDLCDWWPVGAWCEEHYGPTETQFKGKYHSIHRADRYVYAKFMSMSDYVVVYFKHEQDALLFYMTWEGKWRRGG